jgi:hypothetical protein
MFGIFGNNSHIAVIPATLWGLWLGGRGRRRSQRSTRIRDSRRQELKMPTQPMELTEEPDEILI